MNPTWPWCLDLRLSLQPSGRGELVLERAGPYPPPPERLSGRGIPAAPVELDAAGVRVDPALLKALSRAPSRALQPDLDANLTRLSHQLFGGAAGALVQRVLDTCQPPARPNCTDTDDDGRWWVARLVVEQSGPDIVRIPWEALPLPDGSGWLFERLVILRRSALSPSSRPPGMALPLLLSVAWTEPGAAVAKLDDLFDHFTHEAHALGGVQWSPGRLGPDLPHVRHLRVGDEPSIAAWDDALGCVPARVVVLHDLQQRPGVLSQWAADVLRRGSLAVVGVQGPGADAFVTMLYRKLLHNWPVDRAATAAAAELEPGASWQVVAMEGGEHAVLLTRALAEEIGRSERAAWGSGPRSLDEGTLESFNVTTTTAPRRELLAFDDMDRSLGALVTRRVGDLRHLVEGAARISTESETHFVAELMGVSQRLDRSLSELSELSELRAEVHRSAGRKGARPTPRLTQLWLSDSASSSPPAQPVAHLVVGQVASLQLQVAPLLEGVLVAVGFPEDKVAAALQEQGRVDLGVAFFASPGDLELGSPATVLQLPKVGSSTVARTAVTALRPGPLRVRAGLYYRNNLLQSLVLTVPAAAADGVVEGAASLQTDWVASPDLALLDQLPRAAVSLFVNDAADGSHWFGAFAQEDDGRRVRDQQLWEVADGTLDTMARALRGVLLHIEGKHDYLFYGDGRPLDADSALLRKEAIVRLAKASYGLYDALFMADGRFDTFAESLVEPGLVTIARTRAAAASLPWAALYDVYIDTEASQVDVCPVLVGPVEGQAAPADPASAPADLMDDPVACRAQATCPLQADDGRTVCPLGFWGLRHQVEQPIQQVEPSAEGATPEELSVPEWAQGSSIGHAKGSPVDLLMAYYPFDDAELHRDELGDEGRVVVRAVSERAAVLEALKDTKAQVVYFYCHGKERDHIAVLEVAEDADQDSFISPANLRPGHIRWAHRPLVFLNACDSLAMRADVVGTMLHKLRRVGASGVVGTEITVWTALARPFGQELVARMAGGQTIGRAFLEIRLDMMRQLNPLGLVYSFFAPAGLRIEGVKGE